MNWVDWVVLLTTLSFIVGYGTWRTRQQKDLNAYLRGGRDAGWGTVGLSVMATQASAITFLSVPGQAFESGMGFLQFYFGLPLALVIISVMVIPIFYKLNVFTAYEYLEQRFDLKMRLLTAFLFLVQRGLAAGITIYAPAIVLSTVLGWDLDLMNITIGVLVIVYTVTGGTKAVSLTQKWQMAVIMGGMFYAFYMLVSYLSPHASFGEAISIAGAFEKMEIVNFSFDINERYTIWSGLTGGLFLSLSYFGTDQSQVQRYLSGSNIRQSRMGLMFNAILKIPMQFFILLIGILVFVFYQYYERPIHFNEQVVKTISTSDRAEEGEQLIAKFNALGEKKGEFLKEPEQNKEQLRALEHQQTAISESYAVLATEIDPTLETKDSDYVFIQWVLKYLPHGAIGLLLAVIFSAAMSSTAGELNALAGTTMNDFFKRLRNDQTERSTDVRLSKMITVGWGLLAILFALSAQLVDNLIELVNILGSLFYGTILGVFICAFFIKFLRSREVFIAAIVAEAVVLTLFFTADIGFLWFNAIGCAAVIAAAFVARGVLGTSKA
ncbi:MAG: sodium:solute symporter [Flavobacteriales bacterium]|jgi:SSS family transporter|nr:sodium:solute symporter [Flavobacteriales bacterium]NCG30363.1 sodium:solute symporter [Bacteroidota bacterium]MBT4705444.1 sodium:solute symporter [Flavobacteriales bacterium]MBT4930445.1 sodium:solute symporter [Flavobacteriales bacterium]MBT5131722.1 sodium:solute symporter [Flavobacteriales bacterium]